ncbi:hypothetical protein BROC_02032 [Candidatus Brocadiaceae bacterium]|nr:hypothetical protein BROC_02032 [Candidatus Brocadiaceae bacterium]
MKIFKTKNVPESVKKGQYHILTFAETGSSVLDNHAENFGIDLSLVKQFAEQANETDESGTLYPKAPISIIPSKYIRELDDVKELQKQIMEFLNANQQIMRSKKIMLDFRTGQDNIDFINEACQKALKSKFAHHIEEVIIMKE